MTSPRCHIYRDSTRHLGRPTTAAWAPALMALILAICPAAGQSPARVATTTERPVIRFGFSRQIFDSVNENDGRAALKMHAEAMGKSENV
jgi:hypothetical protein